MDNNEPVLPLPQSGVLLLLRNEGPLSRSELHEHTGMRPNTVGDHVAALVDLGLVCEQSAEAQGPGRPRVPLTIDTSRLNVVGAAIRPHHVEACRLNLRGEQLGRRYERRVDRPQRLMATAERVLRDAINEQTYLVGLSTTGFVDPGNRRILFSSAFQGQQSTSLDSLFGVTGQRPLVVDNDMHALAARWLQEHRHPLGEDVLLVYFDDGQLGAALLVRGEPNWGCLVGGNELGHTRLCAETDECYCGHTGCMERICSTEFLQRHGAGAGAGTLLEHVMQYDEADSAVDTMIDLLATGLANPINFIRPHRVVLVSQYTRYAPFINALMRAIRSRVIIELVDRVHYHNWDQPATGAGETAGWLGLAALYHPEWTRTTLLQPPV